MRAAAGIGVGLALGLALNAAAAQRTLPAPEEAVARGAVTEAGRARVEGTLLFDVSQARPGDAFRVGVLLKMMPGWHVYWRNPGDAGLSVDVAWKSAEVQAGPLRWPFPSTFRSAGDITTYGYHGEVLLFSPAQLAPSAGTAGAAVLEADAQVLVCEVECIPADLHLRRALPLGEETRPDAQNRARFDAAQAEVPLAPDRAAFQAVLAIDNSTLQAGQPFSGQLTFTSPQALASAPPKDAFVPDRSPGLARVSLHPVAGAPGRFRVEGEASADPPRDPPRLKGVLRLAAGPGGSLELDLPLPAFAATAPGAAPATGPTLAPALPAKTPPPAEPLSLAWVLLLAFGGGALLNLMPCVFPVLALKTYAFARLVETEGGKTAPHALAYTGGILGAMGALAAVVITLRQLGQAVGWGFQFQQPLFVAAVSAVLVAFALNLFGVFEVGTPGGGLAQQVNAAHGHWRSAGEGVLAVALATPCSAPLLGTAVGFALASGPGVIFTVFLALGLGLAAPFAALAAMPRWVRRLPRPGAWMERLRQLLGFALLGTTVWLCWVLGRLTGVEGVVRLLAFLTCIGLAAWMLGLAQRGWGRRRLVGLFASAAIAVAGGLFSLRFDTVEAIPDQGAVAAPLAFEEAAVKRILADGRPVFVDFTADWCLTCKFNERAVLSRDEVKAVFDFHRVELMVADWTRGDARIGQTLRAHGRAGVPLYLVYSPHRQESPQVLPELLTPQLVREAVERAASPAPPN